MCEWPSKFCNIQENVCIAIPEKGIFFILFCILLRLQKVCCPAHLEEQILPQEAAITGTVIISQAE